MADQVENQTEIETPLNRSIIKSLVVEECGGLLLIAN